MRIGLLGPVRVTRDGEDVAVPGAKDRALLALLAMHAGRVVSDARIIDELWGEDLPGNPANALQKRVSQLRKALGPDQLSRRGDGYVLDVDEVDASVFERQSAAGRKALNDGDAVTAAAVLGAALSLWHGDALADLTDLPFARAEATRLDQLRLSTIEDRIEADLTLARHGEVGDELAALVAAHPLRERLRGQLMVALYRSGRQAQALAAYQEGRTLLAEELGLDPGPELRALEGAILAQDPALGAPPSVEEVATNLPAPVSSFVGRERDLALVTERLSHHRLVTLTGAGGAGKTRLALEVAAGAGRGCDGGVWLAELAPLVDGADVAETVATVVGARDPGGERAPLPPAQRIIDRLGGRRTLVVLDNCEHVLDAAARVAAALLAACPGLRVLATSREPLTIDGEAQVPVLPLLPADAQRLFVERAAAANPSFTGEPSARSAVPEVCERLDGLPLAIELAAARVKTLPVEHIVARLDDRFRLLTGGGRTTAARHQTLLATVAWSYDLLFEDERSLHQRVAVFAGGFDLDAAVAVGGRDSDPLDVEDAVGHLIDKSLLTREGDRYRMLETLRQYAVDRLTEEGIEQEVRAEHARWCMDLVGRAEQGVRGADQLVWLARLEVEHDNIRAAVDWALRADPVLALRLAAGVAYGWRLRGHRQEARRLLDLGLAGVPAGTAPDVRCDGLALAGYLAGVTAGPDALGPELELAVRRQEEALALATELGDEWRIATCERYLAMTLVRRGASGADPERDRADALLRHSAEVLAGLGDDWGAGLSWVISAYGACVVGDLAAIETTIALARPHVVAGGDRYSRERMYKCLALAAELRGDPVEARALHEQALAAARELQLEEAVAANLAQLTSLGSAADATQSTDELATGAAARNRLAVGALAGGDHYRAEVLHHGAHAAYRRLGITRGAAASLLGLAAVADARGDPDTADRLRRQAADAPLADLPPPPDAAS
jgi:predicted ATPase/DNA-binding SARP family transcriptional activator